MSVQPIVSIGHDLLGGPPQRLGSDVAVRLSSSSRSSTLVKADDPVLRTTTEVNDQGEPRGVDSDHGKTRGVIRLLEAGHFNGVADVRLRINFFDELSTRAREAAEPILQEQGTLLAETVLSGVEEMAGSLAVDEETRDALGALVEDFNEAVMAAISNETDSQLVDGVRLEASLEETFDTLVGQLTDLLASITEEGSISMDADIEPVIAVADSPTPRVVTQADVDAAPLQNRTGEFAALEVESVSDQLSEAVEPTPTGQTLDEAIASLRQAFNDSLSALLNSIQSTLTLADPSAPTGQGVAYEKFLATYNELRGVATGVDQLL